MRNRLSDYQEKYGDLYNLEATPAESTAYRFAKHDVEEFPDIITANMNGTPYYTEATMVIECKIMYAAPFDPQYFKSDAPKKMYANFPAGIHSMYIGEVINAWKK